MSETRAEYQTRQSADAIRQADRDTKDAADYLIGVIHDMNSPRRPLHFWRDVVQQVFQRLHQAVSE